MFVMLGICVAVSHGGTVAFGEGFVQTEAEEVHPDGTVVHLSKTSDVDCTFEQDTATLEDGYVSVILKDFTVGKSVLLDSKDPDVCYVRDIPKEEMAKHAKDCAGDHAAQKVSAWEFVLVCFALSVSYRLFESSLGSTMPQANTTGERLRKSLLLPQE
ncbi:hypothetical protein BaRGS_00034298 [Batillaria attramentaria]|uniref:Uncharacterized protein n=1 Tax=Batillaria attramentaria TaxID=370345 RepID=A0ABD0JHP7_9CAEN